MREQLRPLEGQIVHTSARVGSHCQRPNRNYDTVLQNVEVRPYRTDVPQYSVEPIHVDHLWVIEPAVILPVGNEVTGLGRVHYYTRSDGSVDLAVKHVLAAEVGRVMELHLPYIEANLGNLFHHSAAVKKLLSRMEGLLKEQLLYYDCSTYSVDEWLKQMRRASRNNDLQCKTNLSASFSSTAYQGAITESRRERRARARRRPIGSPVLGVA